MTADTLGKLLFENYVQVFTLAPAAMDPRGRYEAQPPEIQAAFQEFAERVLQTHEVKLRKWIIV
jgi:hypothetical protein